MKPQSLTYIIREPKIKSAHPPVLILLHGYGSNEEDLFSFASELPEELVIISARAPISLGMGGYAWYSLHLDDKHGKFSDIPEAIQARELIAKFIDEVKATYSVDADKLFLLGFSQGTILSYAVALSYPEKVHHIIALSGYIDKDILVEPSNITEYQHLDFYISHGSVDQVLPIQMAREAAPYLNKLHIKHVFEEYNVGHGVAPQNFFAFKKWIEERL
ncbi:alpha/beta fold hydrolase [Flavobacteriaceae bacterium F08102]|nr:alpha/beta fold hydrolase [Flavobacteriaceae bacterium F08102]